MAVGSFGLGWGFQVGAALADVVVVFMKKSALESLTHGDGTELHLGPESGIAVGPVGRVAGVTHGLTGVLDDDDSGRAAATTQLPSLEELQAASHEERLAAGRAVGDDLAAKMGALKPAYTYSHCQGLFFGVSLEGSALTVSLLPLPKGDARPATPLV